MRMTTFKKAWFASLNDKRYSFSDGICLLPYGHPFLSDVRNIHIKKEYKAIYKEIQEIKYKILKEESKAGSKSERICILKSISTQAFTYFKLDSNNRPMIKSPTQSTKQYILNGYWL